MWTSAFVLESNLITTSVWTFFFSSIRIKVIRLIVFCFLQLLFQSYIIVWYLFVVTRWIWVILLNNKVLLFIWSLFWSVFSVNFGNCIYEYFVKKTVSPCIWNFFPRNVLMERVYIFSSLCRCGWQSFQEITLFRILWIFPNRKRFFFRLFFILNFLCRNLPSFKTDFCSYTTCRVKFEDLLKSNWLWEK